jgi:alpha-mannosidase
MHEDTGLVEARIRRFVQDNLTNTNYRETAPLQVTAHALPGEPIPPREAIAATYEPFEVGRAWGRPWSTLWLHVTGTVPADWAEDETSACEMRVDLGFTGAGPGFQAEAQVFTPDGVPLKAINPYNAYVTVHPGQEVDLYLECAANPEMDGGWTFSPTGLGEWDTAGDEPLYVLRRLELARRDRVITELSEDFRVLSGQLQVLPAAGPGERVRPRRSR